MLFEFLATGVDDDRELRANHDGFDRYQLPARRLVDMSKVDMSVSLFGSTWDSPIVMAPVSAHKALHAEGEVARSIVNRLRDTTSMKIVLERHP